MTRLRRGLSAIHCSDPPGPTNEGPMRRAAARLRHVGCPSSGLATRPHVELWRPRHLPKRLLRLGHAPCPRSALAAGCRSNIFPLRRAVAGRRRLGRPRSGLATGRRFGHLRSPRHLPRDCCDRDQCVHLRKAGRGAWARQVPPDFSSGEGTWRSFKKEHVGGRGEEQGLPGAPPARPVGGGAGACPGMGNSECVRAAAS